MDHVHRMFGIEPERGMQHKKPAVFQRSLNLSYDGQRLRYVLEDVEADGRVERMDSRLCDLQVDRADVEAARPATPGGKREQRIRDVCERHVKAGLGEHQGVVADARSVVDQLAS